MQGHFVTEKDIAEGSEVRRPRWICLLGEKTAIEMLLVGQIVPQNDAKVLVLESSEQPSWEEKALQPEEHEILTQRKK